MPQAPESAELIVATPNLTVVILTLNEEPNVAQALASVCGWAKRVVVLDSFSTDRTIEVARRHDCKVFQHAFVNYAAQRNHALQNLGINTEWVLFLDADERVTRELRDEITRILASRPEENGFHVRYRLIWMGKWIRRGYYPSWILRLFRLDHARCEDRAVNERLVVEGKTGYLEGDLIHEDHKGIDAWIEKHNSYAKREADLLLRTRDEECNEEIPARLFGTQAERKRWLRRRVWNRLPPLGRPFIYFVYRYFLCLGFLDGVEAFTFHFLQALWFPMLIDIKYVEARYKAKRPDSSTGRISPPAS